MVIWMDDRGKVKLSMKVVDQQTGADISDQIAKEDADRRADRNRERQGASE
jgi:polyribonucleotide nucleotidyltransferase